MCPRVETLPIECSTPGTLGKRKRWIITTSPYDPPRDEISIPTEGDTYDNLSRRCRSHSPSFRRIFCCAKCRSCPRRSAYDRRGSKHNSFRPRDPGSRSRRRKFSTTVPSLAALARTLRSNFYGNIAVVLLEKQKIRLAHLVSLCSHLGPRTLGSSSSPAAV